MTRITHRLRPAPRRRCPQHDGTQVRRRDDHYGRA